MSTESGHQALSHQLLSNQAEVEPEASKKQDEEESDGELSSSNNSESSQPGGYWSVVTKGDKRRSPKTNQMVAPIRIRNNNAQRQE